MGVVYEAEDLTLGRRVAIKFLPDDTAEPSARERFQREARAASSLNHENICTIYEFGEHQGRPFIAMELLEGQTLDRVLAAGPMAIEPMLDYATQIADALDAAHRRQLIHRDIKPSNIFITSRHRAKILDFGLAKDNQTSSLETTGGASPTTSPSPAHLTSPGSTVGTIAYMSPEQARGDQIDGRSDLFSFGAVLYQMATGVLPFDGKTSAVIFSEILGKQQVAPIEKNPAIPEKLDEIINKALEKDPDLRFQTAAEMRGDLKRLKRDSSSGKTRVASPASKSTEVPVAASSAGSRRTLLLGGAAILLIVVCGVGAMLFNSRKTGAPKKDITFQGLTDSGRVGNPIISPDGKLLAYTDRSGSRSLHLKQIATGSDVEIVPRGPGFFGGYAFSPDGNYIYYTHTLPDQPTYGMYVVASLGGAPRQLLTGIEPGIGISPDGRQLAYSRRDMANNQFAIYVSNSDGSAERRIGPDGLAHSYMTAYSLSWSSDSKTIATSIQLYENHLGAVLIVPVDGGKPEFIPIDLAPFSATWLPDGSGFVILGVVKGSQLVPQLYFKPYPKGEISRITNDLNNYNNVSLTADGKTLVTAQGIYQGDVYAGSITAPDDAKKLGINRRLTSMAMVDNNRVVASDNLLGFWTFNKDGSGLTRIIEGDALKQAPAPCLDGRTLLYATIDEKNSVRVARAEYNSNTGVPLTPGPLDGPGFCLPDGQSFAYVSSKGQGFDELMKEPINGGPAVKVLSGNFDEVSSSPDHQSLVLSAVEESKGKKVKHVKVISLKDFTVTHDVVVPPNASGVDVLADNSQVLYFVREGNYDNFFLVPLTGGEPKRLTNFTAEHILSFEPTPDGKSLIFAKGEDLVNAVMISNFH